MNDDMTANLLMEYGLLDSTPIIAVETKRVAERNKIREMASRLKGVDADLDDLLQALLAIHGEEDLDAPVDANTLIIYGVINAPVIKERESQRLEMIFMAEALRNMDIKIDNLLEALQTIRKEFRRI